METRKVEYEIDPKEVSHVHIGHYYVNKVADGDRKYLKILSLSANAEVIILYFETPGQKATIQTKVDKITLAKNVDFYTIEFTEEELQKVRDAVNYYYGDGVPEGLDEKLDL